jgi:hypothetical protein
MFFRRQKEKRINPASISPLGYSSPLGGDLSLYTASLSSMQSSIPRPVTSDSTTTPSNVMSQFHPSLAGLVGALGRQQSME